MERCDFGGPLADGEHRQLAARHAHVVLFAHVLVGRHEPRAFLRNGDPRPLAEAQRLGVVGDHVRAELQPGLVEPGVARLLERLGKVEHAPLLALPVVENPVAYLETGRTIELVGGGEFSRGERREADEALEGGTGRVGRHGEAREQRVVLVGAERRVVGVTDGRDKQRRIQRRPRSQRQNVPVLGVHDHHRAAFGARRKSGLAHALQRQVERGDDVLAGDGRDGNLLRGLLARPVVGDVPLPRFAAQHLVECFFQAVAALGVWEKRLVVLHRPVLESAGTAHIPEHMPGKFSVRIVPGVKGEQLPVRILGLPHLVLLRRTQILKQDPRKQRPVLVVLLRGPGLNRDFAAE